MQSCHSWRCAACGVRTWVSKSACRGCGAQWRVASEVEQLQARHAALKAAVQDLVRIHEGGHDVGCDTAVASTQCRSRMRRAKSSWSTDMTSVALPRFSRTHTASTQGRSLKRRMKFSWSTDMTSDALHPFSRTNAAPILSQRNAP